MRALWSDRQNCSYNVSQEFNVSSAFLIKGSLLKGAICPETITEILCCQIISMSEM